MWTRSELKTKAKADLKICYWKAVLASVILAFCTGGSSGGSSANSNNGNNSEAFQNAFGSLSSGEILAAIAIVLAVVGVALVIGLGLKIFVFNPLAVGGHKFFLTGTGEQGAELSNFGYVFKNNYMNQVLVIFMRDLFIGLWSLLFVIPGVVKSYQYRMVPYLLSEDPSLNYKEALAKSKDMMAGQKWNAFVLDLSFILWIILSACTFGILYVFYVGPYIQFTNAELYVALKDDNAYGYTEY